MQITRGKIDKAKKVVVYGPEGIGKSTFAAQFPDVVFIDTEGSTSSMDVARLPRPTSWNMLLEEIEYIKRTPGICKTLAIDTIDWAEQLCIEHICSLHNKKGIEDFGYGNGYIYSKEEFGRFLNRLTDLVDCGIHVVLTAHAQIRKFEQPDELGAYDRWELKLGKKTSSQTSPFVKEWADMLLFANYKTFSVAVDKDGKKHKAQGGRRVMFAQHHPCWDAKNRFGLPEESDFAYEVIQPIIESVTTVLTSNPVPASAQKIPDPEPVKAGTARQMDLSDMMSVPEDVDEVVDYQTGEKIPETKPVADSGKTDFDPENSPTFRLPDHIPRALKDLMYPQLVSEEEIMEAVYKRGFFPRGTPFTNLPKEFVDGCLIGAWPQVMDVIKDIRKSYKIPFDE